MIVDTSVLIAILLQEQDSDSFLQALGKAPQGLSMCSANLLEAGVVLNRAQDSTLSNQLKELVENFGIQVEKFTSDQAWLAIEAHRTFGKGSGHPAQLNFGDCFAYALAKDLGQPLLFKGNDFSKTDIVSAL